MSKRRQKISCRRCFFWDIDSDRTTVYTYSSKPKKIAKRKKYNSRKKAKEAAKQAGNGDPIGPENHGQGPHYHPNVPKNSPKIHDHYYFPKGSFVWLIFNCNSDENDDKKLFIDIIKNLLR